MSILTTSWRKNQKNKGRVKFPHASCRVYLKQTLGEATLMNMIIRVSGHPGSGSTTFCKKLKEKHPEYEYFYMGKLIEEMAHEQGMRKEDFYTTMDEATERALDDRLTAVMAQGGKLIAEGRMTAFMPCPHQSITILFTVNEVQGAARLMMRPENTHLSYADACSIRQARLDEEHKHYKDLYSIADHYDRAAYDICVDTTEMTADKVWEYAYAQIVRTARKQGIPFP